MWPFFIIRYTLVCAVFGSMVTSTTAAGLLGSLLGENDNNNNNPKSSNIPLIGPLAMGSNKDEQNGLNGNNNQYTYNNNNNRYTNNNNARGLLSVLGGNANANKPNANSFNNLNRFPNIGNNKPSNNINDLKNQVKDAEKLLERIKELNRLKEQQMLEKDDEKNRENVAISGNDKSVSENNNANSNGDSKITMKGVLKSLTKKKFYFMVKPVVPENEAEKYDQTVYYAD